MPSALPLPSLFRLLADRTRLRVLALVAREELAAGELARILGLAAPRLSNHLRLLREAGLIADRREGGWTFIRINAEGGLPDGLWGSLRSLLEQDPEFMGDAVRLRDVLEARRNRSRAYFDRVAPHWDTVGSLFRTGVARQRVAASLVHPHLVVADVGCGTGYLSWALASLVGRLILVDHSPAMLEQAKENLRGCRASLEFRAGEIDQLPLADNEVDAVLAGMVLHHAPDLLAFVREAFRALRPGGVFVIQDLLPHREAWLRDSMADLRLGLVPGDLTALLEKAGFESPEVEVVEDSYTPERPDGGRADLSLFVVRGRRPNGAASRTLNRSMSCPS